jgi:hypothetical protein
MKMFIPLTRDRFRLVDDLMVRAGLETLPAGTVFAFDGFKVNKTIKADKHIGLRTVMSPDPKFSMRKYGGTADFGHYFSLTIEQLRAIDVEIVEDMD